MHRRLLTFVVGTAVCLMALGCSDDTGNDDAGLDGDVAVDSGPADAADADAMSPDGDTVTLDGSDTDLGDGGSTDAGDAGGDDGGQPPCRRDGQCPGHAVCEKETGQCKFYRFVQIKDVTRERSSSSQAACDQETAGADLFQLELRGPFDNVRGYAQTVDAALTSQANNNPADVFDGVGNSLYENDQGALCPSGGIGPNTTLSLGCDGVLAVLFTDGAGNILNLATGQQLVVHEYGNQCCTDGCPEEYWEVRICTANRRNSLPQGERDENGNFPTCDTRVIATGKGRDKITLQLPR